MRDQQELLTKIYNMKIMLEGFYEAASETGNVYDFIFKMGEWKTTLLKVVDELKEEIEQQDVTEPIVKSSGCKCGCRHN